MTPQNPKSPADGPAVIDVLPYGGEVAVVEHTPVNGILAPPAGLTRSDGSPWPITVTAERGTICAESATSVIEVMVPEYAELGDDTEANETALLLRWRLAVQIADATQGRLAADAAEAGLFDPSAESEETLTAIFTSRRQAPEDVTTWDHPTVPLVLIFTDYAPYTLRQPPRGNISWIDPSDEMSLLKSLDELDVLSLTLNDEPA